MTQITHLLVTNFKRLIEVDVDIDGNTIVGGNNTEGKSSLLDAVEAALVGATSIPEDPVHHGADSATIKVVLDNGLVIERTITPDRKHKLKITGGPGGVTPQRWLDGHVSATTLDPLQILSLPPREKAVMLRQLTGVDTSELDSKYRLAYEERATAKREAAELNAALDRAGPALIHLPEEPVDASELLDILRRATAHNAAVESDKKKLEDLRAMRTRQIAKADELRAELNSVLSFIEKLDNDGMQLKRAVAAAVLQDTVAIEDQIASCTETNAGIARNKRIAELSEQAEEARLKVDALSALVNDIDAARKKKVEEAKWPLPGLSIVEGAVHFKGVPLEQASQAEQLRVAVALASASKPDVGVVLIREGCRLDQKSLGLLLQEVSNAGLQAFVERVGPGDTGAIIIEDGRVRG